MVGLPSLADAAPAVRRPFAQLGPGDGDAWRAAILSARCDLALAPSVGSVVVDAVGAEAPSVPAIEDAAELTLGYGDGEEAVVLTGHVINVEHRLDGRLRIRLADDGWKLARTRLAQSWEQQGVADLIGELAGEAGVDVTTIAGPILPFVALDREQTALRAIVELAMIAGCWVYAAPAGGLVMARPEAGQVVQSFSAGVDILACRVRQSAAASGAIEVAGYGAAGSSGEEAWPWPARQPPLGEAGEGVPARRLAVGALRSQEAVDGLAEAMAGAASLRSLRADLLVPGAPQVSVGSTISTDGASSDALNGEWLVVGVRHRYAAEGGFTSRLQLLSAAGGGSGGVP